MRFQHDIIRELILPGTAQPGDAQIRIGPDVPSCMVSRYAAVIMFMPDGWNGGIGAEPTRYLGIRTDSGVAGLSEFEEGWLVWDDDTVCGFVVTRMSHTTNDGAGLLDVLTDYIGGALFTGGSGISADLSPALVIGNSNLRMNTIINDDILSRDFGASAPGVSMGRGLRYWIASDSATGAIGTSFTVILSSGTDMIWRNDRAYEILVGGGGLVMSATTVSCNFVLNVGTIPSDITVYDFGWVGPQNPTGSNRAKAFTLRGILKNDSGADITDANVYLYIRSSSGTTTWTNDPSDVSPTSSRWLEIRDIGDASDYPSAKSR